MAKTALGPDQFPEDRELTNRLLLLARAQGDVVPCNFSLEIIQEKVGLTPAVWTDDGRPVCLN